MLVCLQVRSAKILEIHKDKPVYTLFYYLRVQKLVKPLNDLQLNNNRSSSDELGLSLLAGRKKKTWGRAWESMVAMGVALVMGGGYGGRCSLDLLIK